MAEQEHCSETMKLSFFSILVIALSLVSVTLAYGQDGPHHVAVQLDVIQVDQSQVAELLSHPRDTLETPSSHPRDTLETPSTPRPCAIS